MSHDYTSRLVYMANQIGDFFKYQPRQDAAEGIATHIRKFWDPRMRKQIYAHLDAGGEGLDPVTRRAIEIVREKDNAVKTGNEPEHTPTGG
jgi:formate dehydrogenase subunit delta